MIAPSLIQTRYAGTAPVAGMPERLSRAQIEPAAVQRALDGMILDDAAIREREVLDGCRCRQWRIARH